MESFRIALTEAVERKQNDFIIVILIEKIPLSEVPRELRPFMKHRSCIDAIKTTENLAGLIRYVMVKTC